MAIRKRVLNLPPLFGGCRYIDNILSIRNVEAYILKNVHINERGITYTRGGSRLLNSTSPSDEVTSIHEYARPSGSKIIRETLVTIGKNWYKLEDGTLTRIGTLNSDNKPSVVTFNDGSGGSIAILANGVDFVKYDGTDVTQLLSDFSDFVATFKPKYLFVYENRLMASGCADTPTRIYASGLLDPTSWGADAYFSYDDDKEPINGIGSAWSFLVAFKKNSVYIDSEGNPESTTLQQTLVARGFGASSHWGIVTVGDNIFFGNQTNFYSGVLRSQTTDGLQVHIISDNINKKFLEINSFDEYEGIYVDKAQEIRWGVKTGSSSVYNTELVYNTALSHINIQGLRQDIWNGWWEGTSYEVSSYGLITNTNGSFSVYRGDSKGKVYIMEEDFTFKDDDSDGTGQDIETLIHLGPALPSGLAYRKNFRKAILYLFQNVNGSTTLQYNMSGRYRKPDTGVVLKVEGHISYWNDGFAVTSDPDITAAWTEVLWADAPMLPYPVGINDFGTFIELIITNDGSEDQDKIAYGGAQITYQIKRGL